MAVFSQPPRLAARRSLAVTLLASLALLGLSAACGAPTRQPDREPPPTRIEGQGDAAPEVRVDDQGDGELDPEAPIPQD